MTVYATIIADLTAAMKEGAERKKETLRMLKAEIMKEEVAGEKKRELTDEEVLKLVRRLVKQRKESAEQFRAGGREELAVSEEMEIAFLEVYLPAQMTDEELSAVIAAKKAELGVVDASGSGRLVGAVCKEVGDRAEGGRVKELVQKSF